MMISDLIDQQDFIEQLRLWGLAPPSQLADCVPVLTALLAEPDGSLWRRRLETLLANRALLHPGVLKVVEQSLA